MIHFLGHEDEPSEWPANQGHHRHSAAAQVRIPAADPLHTKGSTRVPQEGGDTFAETQCLQN